MEVFVRCIFGVKLVTAECDNRASILAWTLVSFQTVHNASRAMYPFPYA